MVFFPGYGTTRLVVTVTNQRGLPDCPRNGSFEDVFTISGAAGPFSQVCRDKLLTLNYDRSTSRPMPERFSRPLGVKVGLANFGKVSSAPAYADFFARLAATGYQPNRDLRVAGYNFRLTPDMDGFLVRTRNLIEATYRSNGGQRVRLVGHSNGSAYAQYLLTHVCPAWKKKYLQGFTTIAGNFPGQGSFYSKLFIGMNLSLWPFPTTQANAASSARLLASSPSTYLTAANPRYFGRGEVVVRDSSTNRSYTPRDFPALLARMGIGWAQPIADYYLGFVRFAAPRYFPGVDTTAERGSGLSTPVGLVVPSLASGQVLSVSVDSFLLRTGDGDQEDTTNLAVGVWRRMPCHRFRLLDNPGVSHSGLPTNEKVVSRLLNDLARRPSTCAAA